MANSIGNAFNNKPIYSGSFQSIVTSGFSAGISAGIGHLTNGIKDPFIRGISQAGLHGLSGGILSAAQGGSFGSGFLSSAIASGSASAAGDNPFGTGSIGVIAIGGISGGLSSTLFGGGFWDGFKQGVIVTAMNHTQHLQVLFKVDQELEAKGLNPLVKPDYSLASLLILDELPSIMKLILLVGRPAKVTLGGYDGKSKYTPESQVGDDKKNKILSEISMAPGDFSTWRQLAVAYGHEWVHRYNFKNYSNILMKSGYGVDKNDNWSFPHFYNETLAHFWSGVYGGNMEPFKSNKSISIRLYGKLVKTFLDKQKITP